MKPSGKLAVTVLVACTVVACGKRESQKAKTQDSAAPKPIAAVESTPQPFDDEGALSTPSPAITGPVSYAEAESLYQAKKYDEATKAFEAYTIRKPSNPWGHYMLGLSAWKSGDLVKSELAFESALSTDPMHVKSFLNLSRVLIEQKRYDEAIDTLTRAGEVDPESATVPRLMARAFSAQHKTDEAIDAYRRAIALDMSDAWSMNNLGLLYLELGFVEDAVPYLAKAVLTKDVAAFHNNLGMALEHQGRFVAAATAYKGALNADPGYRKAKQNLTRVEAVTSGPEEPLDLVALARSTDEDRTVAGEDSRAAK